MSIASRRADFFVLEAAEYIADMSQAVAQREPADAAGIFEAVFPAPDGVGRKWKPLFASRNSRSRRTSAPVP